MKSHKKQQGAVLLMAMIFLLVITIIAVNAVSSSSIKTQVAGNNMSTMLVYQGAESAIAKSVTATDEKYLDFADVDYPAAKSVDAVDLPDENVTAGAVLTSKSEVLRIDQDIDCYTKNGDPISNIFRCSLYQVDATSSLKATNARDRHLLGIKRVKPL